MFVSILSVSFVILSCLIWTCMYLYLLVSCGYWFLYVSLSLFLILSLSLSYLPLIFILYPCLYICLWKKRVYFSILSDLMCILSDLHLYPNLTWYIMYLLSQFYLVFCLSYLILHLSLSLSYLHPCIYWSYLDLAPFYIFFPSYLSFILSWSVCFLTSVFKTQKKSLILFTLKIVYLISHLISCYVNLFYVHICIYTSLYSACLMLSYVIFTKASR